MRTFEGVFDRSQRVAGQIACQSGASLVRAVLNLSHQVGERVTQPHGELQQVVNLADGSENPIVERKRRAFAQVRLSVMFRAPSTVPDDPAVQPVEKIIVVQTECIGDDRELIRILPTEC